MLDQSKLLKRKGPEVSIMGIVTVLLTLGWGSPVGEFSKAGRSLVARS